MVLCLLFALVVPDAAAVQSYRGVSGGAAYVIDMPSPWNGTLLLYSHGSVAERAPNPAWDVGDYETGRWLLAHGFALAGSSYRLTGWTVEEAELDQVRLLDRFERSFGRPRRVIAWGHSLGGLITVVLAGRHPDRVSAALPMCGVLAGSLAYWSAQLDEYVAFDTLLAGPAESLPLVHVRDVRARESTVVSVLARAQSTAAGRARLGLVAALREVPGWYPGQPEPARDDFAAQEQAQHLWLLGDLRAAFGIPLSLEERSGGLPVGNVGVDYLAQLQHSVHDAEVRALYAQAHLSLDDDLAALARAPRVAPDPAALRRLSTAVPVPGAREMVPTLAVHDVADGAVVVQNETAFRDAIVATGQGDLLRQVYVHAAGHCNFTPAETVSALLALVDRLDTGSWSAADARLLDVSAAAVGTAMRAFRPRPPPQRGPAFVCCEPTTGSVRPRSVPSGHVGTWREVP